MTYDPTTERSAYRVEWHSIWCVVRTDDGAHVSHCLSSPDAMTACALLMCGLSLDAVADLMLYPAPMEIAR